ncbi:hypothetical protein C8Q74DRAFT_1304456 [Fomes fomentarius]|nr:hypothetical protein C8Q74DRAFT_1304456 [Fomes fomentarius]
MKLPLSHQRHGIARLPTEILAEVFTFAAMPVTHYSYPYHNWTFPRGAKEWLPILLVCRGWHELACATPILWTTITVYSDVSWLECALLRSGRLLPLDIVFQVPDVIPTALGLLAPYASRIRKLSFQDPDYNMFTVLQLWGVAMPALEEMIYCTRVEFDDRFDLNPTLFPALNALRCGALQVDWNGPLVHRLTSLSIIDAPPSDSFTFDNFLEVMQTFADRSLQHLELCNSFPFCDNDYADEGPFESERYVQFPRLKTLSLSHLGAKPIWSLLSHLRLGPQVHLQIHLDGYVRGYSENKLLGVLDVLPKDPCCLPIYKQATSAKLAAKPHEIKVMCTTSEVIDGKLDVTLAMEDVGECLWEYDLDNALHHLSALFGTSPLTSLTFCVGDARGLAPYRHTVTEHGLTSVFETFPTITTLTLSGKRTQYCHMALLSTLWTTCMQADADSPSTLVPSFAVSTHAGPLFASSSQTLTCLLPQLRVLRFERLLWSNYFIESLRGCLRDRAQICGFKLEELFMELVDGQHRTASGQVYHDVAKLEKVYFHEGADRVVCVDCVESDNSG